jgi:glyoxylase-like metal-dependent hydrolase (beta-lactamase superfamily II)
LQVQVGELDVTPLLDGEARVAPSVLYGRVHQAGEGGRKGGAAEDWAPYRELLSGEDELVMPVGGFLIRNPRYDRVVLVDLGMGPNPPLPCIGGRLLERLEAVGVAVADVTDVVFTHLHFDHIGWASVGGAPVFPNATYRCHERDWEYFTSVAPDDRVTEQLTAVASRFETWPGDGPLLPGVDTVHAPGHTPGSSLVVLGSGTERALLLGDVVHCPVELIDSDWEGLSDVDPALARRTRETLVRELEAGGAPAVAAHFDGLRFGRLLAAEGRRRWVV